MTNIYHQLNELTKYIESHLDEEIDQNKLASFLGVNTYTMQKIFSVMMGNSLADYIRKRRLSSAGQELLSSKPNLVDLAVKYQYNNATAFSRAFEKFHGVKPSQVTTNTSLKNFPRKVFVEKPDKFGQEVNYSTIKMPEITLYGYSVKTNNAQISKDAPRLAQEVIAKHGNYDYGAVIYSSGDREESVRYYCGYLEQKAPEVMEIPAGRWLKFEIGSQQAQEIQEVSQRFYREFLPSCKYNLRDLPELEHYHDGVTDFLVPID